MNPEADVLDVARRRSAALVARDAQALTALHHAAFRFTTPRGDVRDRAQYVHGNTGGSLVWRAQRLEDPDVTIVDDTAILTAVAHDEFERDGTPQAHAMRLTLTFVRDAGSRWIALAGHAGPAL
jgi:ketosteroid isomerase-like protein